MVDDFRLDLDMSAIDDLVHDADVLDLLDDAGDEVASNAAVLAPKDSGGGADSIHAERDQDAEGPLVDVSWDRDHFYMYFPEVGTEHQPATPFLRPALDQTQI